MQHAIEFAGVNGVVTGSPKPLRVALRKSKQKVQHPDPDDPSKIRMKKLHGKAMQFTLSAA